MIALSIVLLILIAAALNRARGDASWMPSWLPGRALYYASAGIGLASLLLYEPRIALAWGLAYLMWGIPAWGRWFDLNRLPDGWQRDGEEPSTFEQWITDLAGGRDHIAMFLRHLCVIPGLALVAFGLWSWWPLAFALPFAALALGCYELGWRLTPAAPIRTAELFTGALWGVLIAGVSYVV